MLNYWYLNKQKYRISMFQGDFPFIERCFVCTWIFPLVGVHCLMMISCC